MRKIIDSHLHISKWGDTDFISCFDNYIKAEGLQAINICAVPIVQSNVCNNIILGFYKLARPNTYIHAGIEFIKAPIDNMPPQMDSVAQYKELMEIGFDGIKMLEGKPTEHKRIGKSLNHKELNKLYAEMERDGTHLLMHVNDPDEFWDLEKAPKWAIDEGWTYTDGTYSSYEEVQAQAIQILKEHPNLKLTLAHFFFCSKTPELLKELFATYKNLCVDLTPGGEMYVEFEKNYDYYKEFFNKYSSRLIFGTDRAYECDEKYAKWLFDLVTDFVSTSKPLKSFDDKVLMGLDLPQDKKDEILFANFEKRVGKVPKPMNKEKFKAYIEKYSFALTESDKERIAPLIKRYL